MALPPRFSTGNKKVPEPKIFLVANNQYELLTRRTDVWVEHKQTQRRAKKRVLQTPERERQRMNVGI